ncbi:MAG: transposase, partial [Acidimicrobiaceae bacterium]|nr:transposase [Acidimicrobiaceae bacterium]
SRAFPVVKAPNVVEVLAEAATRWGTPASMLSDNGAIFTAAYRGGRCLTEIVLEAQGIEFRHSRPYHPETCGKVERFHQTVKKYLVMHDAPSSVAGLQRQLDTFTSYYNEVRPHRAKGRKTPLEAFNARLKATPIGPPGAPFLHYRIRKDRVDDAGKITLRYAGKLRHIHVGRPHRGRPVLVLVADRDVRVLSEDHELISHVVIDPAKNYQAKSTV